MAIGKSGMTAKQAGSNNPFFSLLNTAVGSVTDTANEVLPRWVQSQFNLQSQDQLQQPVFVAANAPPAIQNGQGSTQSADPQVQPAGLFNFQFGGVNFDATTIVAASLVVIAGFAAWRILR